MLFRQHSTPDPTGLPIADLITAARTATVLRIPTGQRRFDALSLRQQQGEKIIQFFTRARAAVLDCNFVVEETKLKAPVEYTDKIVSLILLQRPPTPPPPGAHFFCY